MRRVFYAPKTYVNIDNYQKEHEWAQFQIQCAQNTFQISEYFEKSKFELSRFYCI